MTDYPDYEGGKQKVYLVPEWAALNAVDKDFEASTSTVDFGEGTSFIYDVPTGKTLYLTQFAWATFAVAAANADLPQMSWGRLIIDPSGTPIEKWSQAGNGGGGTTFPKPIVIPGGSRVGGYVISKANHAMVPVVVASGYEI